MTKITTVETFSALVCCLKPHKRKLNVAQDLCCWAGLVKLMLVAQKELQGKHGLNTNPRKLLITPHQNIKHIHLFKYFKT